MARYSVNKVILVGNLGADPEMRYTANGQPVANFSLATSRGRQDPNGNWVDETEWHRIVCWERLAELAAQSLHKGSKVYVEGRIQSRKYTDNQGIERTSYDIVAHDLTVLDRRTDTDASDDDDSEKTAHLYKPPPPPAAKHVPFGDELDEIPF